MNLKHTESATEMLDTIDTFMSGKPLTAEKNELLESVLTAGIYAAAAYEAHMPKSGGEAYSLTRAFLLALIDPLSEDLDYLRREPSSGSLARDDRKQNYN